VGRTVDSTSVTVGKAVASTRSKSATEDLATVRSQRDALLNRDVNVWLGQVKSEASAMRGFENSLSWKLTRPVRAAGIFTRLVRSDGLGTALGTAFGAMKRRISRR
jgi:hypothetical protein